MKSSQKPPNKSATSSEQPEFVVHWRIDQWFADLSPAVRAKLKTFHEEIVKTNKSINLVSPKTIPMSDAIHFADAIISSRLIHKAAEPQEIFDFGSGCGFPGIIYAVCHEATKVHLVENDPRKIDFLKGMITTLKLANIQIHLSTVEALPDRSVKHAMSRGFAPISKSVLAARKCVVKGGVYFHIKGDEWVSEVGQIPTQLCSYWTPALVEEYKLPISEMRFAVVKTDKISD